MLHLEKLLSKFRQSIGDDSLVRGEVCSTIKEILGFELELQSISINNSVLRIQTTPAKKNEIKLNEARVLEAIKTRTKLNLQAIVY